MEDLFTRTQRLQNLKSLAQKRQQKKAPAKKTSSESYSDKSIAAATLVDILGGRDFGSRFGDTHSFYDVDSALASRLSDTSIEAVGERSFLDDDGIGLD
jgi:hypothetical protein